MENVQISDADTINIFVPLQIKKRGGAAMIILPKDIAEEKKDRFYDQNLLNAFAKAYQWRRWIEEGKFATVAEIRRHEKLGKAYDCRIYRLNLVAPQIVEAIVNGTQPRTLRLESFMKKTFCLYGSSIPFFKQFCVFVLH